MTDLKVTEIGQAVAYSALLPRTAAYFLSYFKRHREALRQLLDARPAGEALAVAANQERLDTLNADLAFILFHLCYCSPEYGDEGVDAGRFIPFPLAERRDSARAARLEKHLSVQPWDKNAPAVNAAEISADWVYGTPLADLEQRFEGLRGGMIREMLRTSANHLSGLADILAAAAKSRGARPPEAISWIDADARKMLRQVIRRLRLYALQAIVGVPDDVLWMLDVTSSDAQPLIGRSLAMAMRRRGLRTLESVLDNGQTDKLIESLKERSIGREIIPRIRQAAQRVRLERTDAHKQRILRRIGDCGGLVSEFFAARENKFEDQLNDVFGCLKIPVKARDDDPNGKPRFPDFLIELASAIEVVIECKSCQNGKDINLGQAGEVAAKAAVHGLNDRHMITVCQQYVGTDVPRLIESAKTLSVVNAEDLAVALAYLKAGTITLENVTAWLTTPGQPQIEELFRR